MRKLIWGSLKKHFLKEVWPLFSKRGKKVTFRAEPRELSPLLESKRRFLPLLACSMRFLRARKPAKIVFFNVFQEKLDGNMSIFNVSPCVFSGKNVIFPGNDGSLIIFGLNWIDSSKSFSEKCKEKLAFSVFFIDVFFWLWALLGISL